MSTLLNKYLKGDSVIWMVSILLSLVSLLAVYSSVSGIAYTVPGGGSTFQYFIKHGFILASGFAIIYLTHRLHYRYYSRLAGVGVVISVGLLLLTLLVGRDNAEATRWLRIPGIDQNFQTSDFAKVALVIYVARMLVVKRDVLNNFYTGLLPILVPVLVVCGLILPANLSTALLLFTVCFIMLLIGGIPFKHLAAVAAVAVGALVIAFTIATIKPDFMPRIATWKSRITNFESGESSGNYQVEHAMMAIKAGGLLPHGPGTGDSRNYLPNAYNDMIFAFIIEEYGLILGGCGIILLYLIFGYRSLRIMRLCERDFGALVVAGLCFLILIQAFTNMAVAVNLFPVTGQVLPLVSWGGTSVWFTCLSVGIILGISRFAVNTEAQSNSNTPKTHAHAAAKGHH